MNSVISAKQLNVGYDKKTVISDVNIEGMKGQIICLLGPNGVGKSTILRTISGLLAPVNGTVQINGENIKQIKKSEIAKKLSIVLTDTVSPNLTTVNELVSMGRMPYTNFMGRLSVEDKQIVAESLEIVGAAHLKDRFYKELSDGEKQKVMIARALVQEPELIVLDEPTSHLDIKHKVEVIRILQKLVNEKHVTVILSLHDIDLALKGCQTVLLINNGQILAQGTPEEIIHSGSIQSLYGIKGAKYNELLGSVEFQGSSQNDIFVTGGNGSGINIYRALSRKGWGISAGIIHENDIDLQVAQTICCATISQEPFSPVSSENIEKALLLVKGAKCVVDTDFPVSSGNRGNIDLLKRSLKMGKTVYSMRNKEETMELLGDEKAEIIYCASITDLMNQIEKEFEEKLDE